VRGAHCFNSWSIQIDLNLWKLQGWHQCPSNLEHQWHCKLLELKSFRLPAAQVQTFLIRKHLQLAATAIQGALSKQIEIA